jgi:hypothetical protein
MKLHYFQALNLLAAQILGSHKLRYKVKTLFTADLAVHQQFPLESDAG